MRALLFASLLALAPLSSSGAAIISLNFDTVALAPGACTDAAPYLASFGLTFVPVTSGASSGICNDGSTISPSSPPNWFFIGPPVTNTDVSGDLLFSTPLTEFSFVRVTVDPATAEPPWDAIAFDASNAILSSVSVGLAFPGPSAQTFTLTGPGITRVRFDAFNSAHVTYNFPPIDDLKLSIPEPGTLALLGLGVGALVWRCRRSPASVAFS